jgi:hypothetical protein
MFETAAFLLSLVDYEALRRSVTLPLRDAHAAARRASSFAIHSPICSQLDASAGADRV